MTASPITQDTALVYTLAAALIEQHPQDAQRIDRALDLVGSVERLPSGQWSVPSSTGQGGYVVSRDARTCCCPDYVRRETACKHVQAVRLFQQAERLDAEQSDPTPDPDAPIGLELTGRAYLTLVPSAALPNPVGTITRLPYTAAQQRIASELYDDEPQGAA